MDIPKDLVAASATPLVLAVLRQGDSYGYEIIKRIRDLSSGQLEWNEGMLYPLLHRLADQGLIEAYQGTSATGRTRKYYRLLTSGRARFEKHREWFALVAATFAALEGSCNAYDHAVRVPRHSVRVRTHELRISVHNGIPHRSQQAGSRDAEQ